MTSVFDEAVDLAVLERWLDQQDVGEGELTEVRPLAGGTQNVLVRFRRGEDDLVLRRPGLRPRQNASRLILREAQVLRALDRTAVPHPELIAVCKDESVMGSTAFLVMRAVDGFNPGESIPAAYQSTDALRAIAAQSISTLADIAMVDYEVCGLADFGRPDGFLHRQVDRWSAEYEGYAEVPEYAGPQLPGFEGVRDYLAERVPPVFTPGLMHGDYHLANLIMGERDGQLEAVVDWEMSTIGDPLLDLGRYLAMLPDDHETIFDSPEVTSVAGAMSAEEVVGLYEARVGRSVDHLDWYIMLGCYKLGIVLEGTYVRACAGKASREVGLMLHSAACRLFERAVRIAGVAA
ncbi:phosphotransferase family protein [Nocardia sp. NPDC059246]|uniref:phosphotransferase family protein n=1 Tax=unclassified Nocardia TaxID=2637762 RepID=UPI00368CCF68